MLFWVYD